MYSKTKQKFPINFGLKWKANFASTIGSPKAWTGSASSIGRDNYFCRSIFRTRGFRGRAQAAGKNDGGNGGGDRDSGDIRGKYLSLNRIFLILVHFHYSTSFSRCLWFGMVSNNSIPSSRWFRKPFDCYSSDFFSAAGGFLSMAKSSFKLEHPLG